MLITTGPSEVFPWYKMAAFNSEFHFHVRVSSFVFVNKTKLKEFHQPVLISDERNIIIDFLALSIARFLFNKRRNFLFSISSRPALGPTQPPIQRVLGVKQHGREADHTSPASAEVKKMWNYTSTPPYDFTE
jgi:hypothetical protein